MYKPDIAVMIAGCASTATRESTGEFIDDSAITANVKSVIYNDPDLKVGQISVETLQGSRAVERFCQLDGGYRQSRATGIIGEGRRFR